ncbi:helix-turn-helix domain-containing protein [Streptomyces kanamyceticus]|uniref:XRE family transcriptional regulator n=1 Tax=Streptomyces kanamyceticus TaxID=1967 RepID=A0A5J6GJE9_STRKN|nr:helix-turn-helix transcriptional regulator [Streptomyces kanamyceticus]QEU93256.1 XRE family transcriptional regulator [Streptomyces kanamyceticus]
MTTATITGNERLRGAMTAANVTIEALAGHLGIDPKSVERWLSTGRTPHARHAHAAARRLDADAYHLWPVMGERRRSVVAPQAEVVASYATRSMVPMDLWRQVLDSATATLDLAVANLAFVAHVVGDLPALLADKAACGVRVRVVIPETLTGRALQIADALLALADHPGIQIATHAGLVADVLRADDDLLVSTPVDGMIPSLAPVLHLRRLGPAPLTGGYLASLDHLVMSAEPCTPAPVVPLRAVTA